MSELNFCFHKSLNQAYRFPKLYRCLAVFFQKNYNKNNLLSVV